MPQRFRPAVGAGRQIADFNTRQSFDYTHLREKVIRPLLAASQRPVSKTNLNNPTAADQHYEHLRLGMRDLFTMPGLAA